MPQPFDYRLNIPNPAQSLLQTVQLGQGIQQAQAGQAAAEQQAQAQASLQTDLGVLSQNPNPAALAKMMVKHPQLSEQFKRTYDVLDAEQQKARVGQASQVYAALEAGQHDVARDLLQEQATAFQNSGMEKEAKTLTDLSRLVELSPDTAKTSAGMFLASAMGPDKFTETFTKLESNRRNTKLEESSLTTAQSKARKDAVEADFAESQAATDLQKKGWDIFKIQEDVKVAKENSRISALNVDLRKQQLKIDKMKDGTQKDSNLLRQEELKLKLDDMKRKRDDAVHEKAAGVESARMDLDNMLNTLDRVMQTPVDVMHDAMGPVDQVLPTFKQATADFEELIGTVSAQAFLTQIPKMKGMGALSGPEGDKLAAALQSFNMRQSPERLVENIKEAQRLSLKARKTLATRHGVPETVPDTPAVETSAEDIESLLQKYGGDQAPRSRR